MDTDSEDDIWDYQSLPRTKSSQRKSLKPQSQKPDRRGKSSGNPKDFKTESKYSTQPCKTEYGKQATKETRQSREKPKALKRSSQSTGIKKDPDEPAKKPKMRTTRRRSSTKKSPVVKLESRTPDEKHAREEGRCPVCQFPFSALPYTQSTSWHIDECLMVTGTRNTECRAGLQCDSTIESHYKKFAHREIYRSSKKKQTYKGCSETGNVAKAKVFLKFEDNITNISTINCTNDLSPVIEISSDIDSGDTCTVIKPHIDNTSASHQPHKPSTSASHQRHKPFTMMELSSDNDDDDDDGHTVIRDKKINHSSKLAGIGVCVDGGDSVSKTSNNSKVIENRDMFITPDSLTGQSGETTVDYDDCDEVMVRETFENLEGDSLAESLVDVIETASDGRDVSDMLQDALYENRNPVEKHQTDSNSDDSVKLGSECGEDALDEIDSLSEERIDNLSQGQHMFKIENCFSLRTSTRCDMFENNTELSESESEGMQDKGPDRSLVEVCQNSSVQKKSANDSLNVRITKTTLSKTKGKNTQNTSSEKCLDMVYSCNKLLYDETLDRISPRDKTCTLDDVSENPVDSTTPVKANKAASGKGCNVEGKRDTKCTETLKETKLLKKQSQVDRKNVKKINARKESKDQKPIESFFLSKAKKLKVESEIKTEKNPVPMSNNIMSDKLHQHSNRVGTSQSERCSSRNIEQDNELEQDLTVDDSAAVDSCIGVEDSSEMAGGFFPESQEIGEETMSTADSNWRFLDSATASQTGNTENSELSSSSATVSSYLAVHQTVAEKVSQITKNAADILRASSKLLYRQIASGSGSSSYSMQRGVGRGRASSAAPRSNWASGNERNTSSSAAIHVASEENEEETTRGFGKRKCPFYKKIPGTYLTVDAFKYGEIPDCRAYILSHFHYDHYGGLSKHFKQPIYCSQITANLVKQKIRVDSRYIHPVPLDTPTVVENVEITFLEANHCPGAVLILFKLSTGKVYLHTGDFRANRTMEEYPSLRGQHINLLYLDTTYCDPQYSFPPQEEVVAYTVKLVKDTLDRNPKTLIVCGSYTIGKERIFTAIAKLLNCKICVMRDKKNVLDCLEDDWLRATVSLRWEDSRLHVLPMNKLNHKGLLEHLTKQEKKYDSVLALEPTGWTFSKKLVSLAHIQPKINRDGVKIYGIPYSEHSSFLEMKRFVQFTKPDKILPTVNNGNIHSRKRMEVIFEAWKEEAAKKTTHR